MTVSTTNNRISYTGNGSTTVFAFPYKFIAGTDIKVYVAGSLVSSGYTVGTPSDAGANVTFSVAPAAGASIVILCDPDMLQASALPGTGPFPSTTVERMVDKLTLIVQRLRDLVNRAMVLPDSFDGTVSTTLPTPSANRVIGWNSTGDALTNLDAADLATTVLGSNKFVDVFNGDGATTVFTMSSAPQSKNNVDVFISGVYQQKSKFSVSGTTITFAVAPPAGTGNVEVEQQVAVTYPVSSLAPDSVTATAIQDLAIPTKINAATSKSTPVDADEIGIADSEASFILKKLTIGNLIARIWSALGSLIATGTGKATPVDADYFPIMDSAASNATKSLSWANIKATLKAYFDTLYASATNAQRMQIIATKASTSGTSIDFSPADGTGIPSWANRITASLVGVSTTGTSPVMVQIGSGSPLTSGYLGCCHSFIGGSGSTSANNTTGAILDTGGASAAASVRHGSVVLERTTGNVWQITANIGLSNAVTMSDSGFSNSTLGGVLDRIRFTTVGGVETFDAGSITMKVEG